MSLQKLVTTILLIVIPLFTTAQEYSFVKYDEKDGLASSTVYDICQDTAGFIWFATENGVSRFDGTHFITYTTRNGLPDNTVLKIHADKKGRILIVPFTYPIYVFQGNSFKELGIKEKYRNDIAYTIDFHNFGKEIFIQTSKSHIYTITDTGEIISWKEKYKDLPENTIISFADDSVIIIKSGDTFYSKTDESFKLIYKKDPVKTALKYKDDKVLIYADEVSSKPISPSKFLNNKIFCGFLNNIVYFFDCETGKLLYKIQIEKYSSALIDTENNLWITTLGNGVYRFPSRSFRQLKFNSGSPEIFSITGFDDQVMAGTDYSHLQTFNPRNGEKITKDFTEFLKHSSNPIAVSTGRNRIYKLIYYDHELYAGSDAFLIKKNRTGKYLIKYVFPVKDIDIDDKELLLCLGTGALRLNATTLAIEDTLLVQRTTTGVIYNDYYFIGTIGGLIKIHRKTKAMTRLNEEHVAFSKRIVAIKKGRDNDLWIATSGSGLIHYQTDHIIGQFNSSNGISSDICTSLFIDSNEVWLGTVKGLNRILFTGSDPKIIHYTTSDGLASNTINAVFVNKNTVYAGTAQGITFFDKEIISEKSTCQFQFLGVSVNDSILPPAVHYQFPYRTLNIRFDFVGISYKSTGDILYYYQVKGLGEKWSKTSNTFVNFTALPPGTYHFKIKAINKFGVESAMNEITITINKPWWQTWWFISIVFLLLFSLILWLYKRRINFIKRTEQNKRKLYAQYAALEQQALQAQMNPHFIFNCLNSIQSFILNQDVVGANRYLNNFASLIRQTLDNSADMVILLATEIKYLETYLALESMRFEDKFSYSLTVDKSIDTHDTYLPGMLIQPYIENAIRHGIQHRADNQGIVSIQFIKNEKGNFTCVISDNGVGRKKSQELKSSRHIEYMSKGISITQKRIEMLNKQYDTNIIIDTEDITGEDNSVSGTKVTINFPDSIFKK
jgi:hypothetical protein